MTDHPRCPRAIARAAPAAPHRRLILSAGAGLAAALALRGPARAAGGTVRIGFQKYGSLVLLKGRGNLEKTLNPLGWDVAWSEFPAGPPLMEALNAGAVDFGSAGEAPPIFAQAASPDLRYVGAEPSAPKGEAILVPKDSAVRTLADLRGKTIALNKGSNVHFLLVRALESAKIPYTDVKLAFLAPADANAAFVRGAVDAWAIWDPYLAAAERSTGARILADAQGLAPNRQFYLSRRAFVEAQPEIVQTLLQAIGDLDTWASGHTEAVAAELAPAVGIPAPVLTVALGRQTFGVAPLDATATAEQQKVADAFLALGLLPKPVRVADAVWPRPDKV